MAEECDGNSVATTSPTPFNWWYLHANSVPSWNNTTNNNLWNNQTNPNSSSSCEEDISVSSTSFTNTSNHSSLTVESSRRLVEPPPPSSNELMGEHASDNQLWSHVLSGVGSNGELHNNQEMGENFLDALSSKNMFVEPACDYLKKLDTTNSTWEYSGSSTPFNNSFEKHLNNTNGFNMSDDEAMILHDNNERLTKLSNLVSTWSIAPPDPSHNNNNNMPLNSSNNMDQLIPQSFGGLVFPNCYDREDNDHDMKVKEEYHHQASEVFGKSFNTIGYQNGLISGLNSVGESGKFYQGLSNLTSCARNFSDVISFNSRLRRPASIGINHAQKPNTKYSNLSESKKQGLQTLSPIRTNNGRGEGTTAREVKKKRSEESSEATLKKPKQDTSTTGSSTKVQGPKVKLGDKITALQQIVSPFGKTDTASVLFEAIGYIKFLQEQVQLLSNPYMKSNSHKDPWGSMDRKEKEDGKSDLRSRGLCLVPTSCTPLVYRDNTGPDYWTPAYRGCLYR